MLGEKAAKCPQKATRRVGLCFHHPANGKEDVAEVFLAPERELMQAADEAEAVADCWKLFAKPKSESRTSPRESRMFCGFRSR